MLLGWLEAIGLKLGHRSKAGGHRSPSLLGWMPLPLLFLKLEAIAVGLEAIALKLEAIAVGLEAIAIRFGGLALSLQGFLVLDWQLEYVPLLSERPIFYLRGSSPGSSILEGLGHQFRTEIFEFHILTARPPP